MRDECAVLDWAASGAMALTGLPDGPPLASPARVMSYVASQTRTLAQVTQEIGTEVRADPAELLAGRAALTGFTRGGQVSAGGSGFLLRAADGWCAVTLSRPDDVAAVPAIAGALGFDLADLGLADLGAPGLDVPGLDRSGPDGVSAARGVLAAAARARPGTDFAAAAQLLGVPAAVLPTLPPGRIYPSFRVESIAPSRPGARLDGAVVADLSAMWAGPLCAHLLGRAGADVIKVESPGRPDGARAGNTGFFDWLHAGHRSLAVDFTAREGRSALAALLEVADVVIESSRPRALAALGLAPDMIPHPPGQVWLSITGYGQAEPDRVAFGDDAAVAGGLVGWTGGAAPEPVFCADAVADPLAGVVGALAVARARAQGGGTRIDLSMSGVARVVATSPAPDHGPHPVRPDGTVTCARTGDEQAVRPPRPPVRPPGRPAHAAALGADTGAVLEWLARRRAC